MTCRLRPLDRLMRKVEVTPTCWLWRGGIDRAGYGRASVHGRGGTAHRAIYSLMRGPVPSGLDLDHLCRVRNCVNPDHLEPVTHRENCLRGDTITGRHARQTHCLRGHLLEGDNLYPYAGKRECRACSKLRQRRRVARRQAERDRERRSAA